MLTPDLILDCRDDLCPGPMLKVAKALRSLALNQVLEVRVADHGSVPDMQALVTRSGHEILGVEEEADSVRILIRRLR